MMRKLKKIMSVCLVVSMFAATGQGISAKSLDIKTENIQKNQVLGITNKSTKLTDSQAAVFFNDIQQKLKNQYQEEYELENFRAIFVDVENQNNSVDVDVIADMILIKDPTNNEYVQGMKEAVADTQNAEDKVIAQKELDEYIADQMLSYNVADETTFCYRIEIPTAVTMNDEIIEYETFYRTDIAEDESILTSVPENPQLVKIGLGNEQDGKEAIAKAIEENKGSDLSRAVTYNKADAVKYAKDHAKDEPEFSKANNMGSDCANFVSKCINAGGIPVDKTGKWNPSAKAGDYAGVNWMRTGYYKDSDGNYTGVKTYMVNKGYFKKSTSTSVTKGGFMFWNKSSHVALVVSNTSGTIKYSQHSNVQQSQVTKTYGSEDVTFYTPK